MSINMIVAAGADGSIGQRGDLIWRIPADLKRFKELTMGHPIIMGRKTWESLRRRPLPGRRNIVVTRNTDYDAEGGEVVASPTEAVSLAGDGAFVIGGAQIYRELFPMVQRIYLTAVASECPTADARLPWPIDTDEWRIEEESDLMTTDEGVRYRYITYMRV